MPRRDRAAQFAPFAALTGFDGDIAEEARLTDERFEINDETAAYLDECIRLINENIKSRPAVTLTLFVPDLKKTGGKYVTFGGSVRRVDAENGVLIFADGHKILLADICDIKFADQG